MGFEMDQETSGGDPVRLFVFQRNFDSVVLFPYFWLLKDNSCCEYRCFHGPSVNPTYAFVSDLGLCILRSVCCSFLVGGTVHCFGSCMVYWLFCFLVVS